jgi:D-arabinose 1-dehydrogenase-like Zn-dependent alcohol dehydrogenase
MRAAYYEDFQQPLSLQELPEPAPADHGVVIRVGASGLCRSDWHGWMGHDPDIRPPHVPGHEFAGLIAALGKDVRGWRVGERVTVPFVCACGACAQCLSGNHQVCERQTQPGFTHWGSFAEYVAIDHAEVNLVRLPADLDDVTAASLGCRFATSFRAVVDQAGNAKWVAVHGCRGGLSAVMIAQAVSQRVAVDITAEKLALAQSSAVAASMRGWTAPWRRCWRSPAAGRVSWMRWAAADQLQLRRQPAAAGPARAGGMMTGMPQLSHPLNRSSPRTRNPGQSACSYGTRLLAMIRAGRLARTGWWSGSA